MDLDDVVGMRSTLSQPDPTLCAAQRPPRRPTSYAGKLLGSVALFAALATSGCSDEANEDSATEPSAIDPIARAQYAWPTEPNHPIAQIDIDGAAGTGTIEIEFFPELAPSTVAQMTQWIDEGYFDGTTFHRVIEDFMIQGGDPNTRDTIPANDGRGGPGFALEDEFSDAPFLRGVVAMGNEGRENTAGSQFFIMQTDHPGLDGRYTVIGRVRAGIELVDAVTQVQIDQVGRWGPEARPIENVIVSRIRRLDSRLVSTNP